MLTSMISTLGDQVAPECVERGALPRVQVNCQDMAEIQTGAF
jgi:hypothetical protein